MLSFKKSPKSPSVPPAPAATPPASSSPGDALERYHEEATSWHTDRLAMLEEREARARWTNIVFGIGMVLGLLAAAGAYWRPAPEPHVLQVDASTGRMERVTVLGDGKVARTTANARYNLEKFVKACEGYIPQMIQFHADTIRWNTAHATIRDACIGRMQRRVAAYEYGTRIDVEIVSVVLPRPRVATVRFRTLRKALGTAAEPEIKRYTANIVYVFDNALELPEAARDSYNPDSFVVREYLVTEERVIDDPEPLPTEEPL